MNLRPGVIFSVLLALCLQLAALSVAADRPSVLVRTAPLEKGRVLTTISSYGTAAIDPRQTVTVSFPRAGRVTRLLVAPGQVVRSGEPLLAFETDPSALLAFRQASSGLDLARAELARTETMVAQKLATQSQLASARKAAADAEATLEAQRTLGTGRLRERGVAPFAGIVTAVQAKEGDQVAAGAPLLQLSRRGALTVLLGVEPEHSARITAGMPVRMVSVFDPRQEFAGRVREVHGVVDPQTRLVEVVVGVSGRGATRLIPGSRLRGEITVTAGSGWLVPRSAVLRDAQGAYLYQADRGRARRIRVATGVERDGSIEVRGRLDPRLKVVVLGNYELSDGMALREEEP